MYTDIQDNRGCTQASEILSHDSIESIVVNDKEIEIH